MVEHVCLKFIDFFASFRFHSQEQKSGSTPSLFKEGGTAPNYSYRHKHGTKSMCLICDCNGNLSLSNKPVNDRHCIFSKLCPDGDDVSVC